MPDARRRIPVEGHKGLHFRWKYDDKGKPFKWWSS
jgi:hypothetical protein